MEENKTNCHKQLPWTTTSLVAPVFIFQILRPKSHTLLHYFALNILKIVQRCLNKFCVHNFFFILIFFFLQSFDSKALVRWEDMWSSYHFTVELWNSREWCLVFIWTLPWSTAKQLSKPPPSLFFFIFQQRILINLYPFLLKFTNWYYQISKHLGPLLKWL